MYVRFPKLLSHRSTAIINCSELTRVFSFAYFRCVHTDSEKTNNLQPIYPHDISISPTGHVLLTLDTLARSGPGGGGRDLLVWGANQEYQLGNGKRGSLAQPTALHAPDGERFMLGKRTADVKDLRGRVWKRRVTVEQCAVAGWGNSLVYWRICP